MRFRLSNGYSFSVEFSAGTPAAFRKAATIAYTTFREAGHSLAELHVATDIGEWLSPRYPQSNAPFHIFGVVQIERAAQAVALSAKSNRAGTWFEHEIDGLSSWTKHDPP